MRNTLGPGRLGERPVNGAEKGPILAGFVSMNGSFFVLSDGSVFSRRGARVQHIGLCCRSHATSRPDLSPCTFGQSATGWASAVARLPAVRGVGFGAEARTGLVRTVGQLADPSRLAHQSIATQPTDGRLPYRG